ncbi:MAG: hypothetical protein HYU81_00550 [Candidatus Brennerbacteria bacterium]|nr:hypothetical protein [Candidatus Brennerbacteria bacterium]
MKGKEHSKAVELRRRGYSVKEITRQLGVAQSSVSLWVRDILLSDAAKARLLKRIKVGQFISAENKKARTRETEERYFREALKEIRGRPDYTKILCAMIYWCEGTKNVKTGLTFTNSDSSLVKVFLRLLRKSFKLDEAKFRPCIHIHSYHSAGKQLDFWSQVTNIDKSQFIKPYRKPNSGKYIHEGYQGCISIKYHSNDLARRLTAVAKAFMASMGA